ncbi:MAG: ABC-2 type transport system ATP-binding protein [Planctomycetota bacterium]|jgi:ABC-2 type transport system ATP-binding protein
MIHVNAVVRSFGSLRAVDDVSFRIEAGEIVGFLGPNGAGKSTLLRMMATFLPPCSGRIEIAGHDTQRQSLEARARLGYLPEHNSLYERMHVVQLLRFIGRSRGLEGKLLEERLDWVADNCQLQAIWKRRVRDCSKGYRQRVGLAAALIHDPPVLLLDEPTHGLDPIQVVALREFLHELRPGRAILFSSHILAEVAQMSDRLLVINNGQLCMDAGVAQLEEQAHQAGETLESLVIAEIAATSKSGEVRA